jgi:plasmid maintenance system antidote protein VapI
MAQKPVFVRKLDAIIESPVSTPFDEFRIWLAQQLRNDGRTVSAIGEACGVHGVTLGEYISGRQKPSERNVRTLACAFGADPDSLAALAGFADLTVQCQPPGTFSTLRDWLTAVLQSRSESPEHASRVAGIRTAVCREIVYRGYCPTVPELGSLAAYFRVETSDLYALAAQEAPKWRSVSIPSTRPDATFLAELARLVQAQGQPLTKVAQSVGVAHGALHRVLTHLTARPTERMIRRLAIGFGAEPDVWAALAGYANVRATVPDPYQFTTLQDFARAALQARGESPEHAARRAGISGPVLRHLVAYGNIPEFRAIHLLAAYWNVSRASLRSLRPKNAGRVAQGKANIKKIGLERMREFARNASRHLTTEQRREYGKGNGAVRGAVSKRRRRREDWQVYSVMGLLTRKLKQSDDDTLNTKILAQMRAAARAIRLPKRMGRPPTLLSTVKRAKLAAELADDKSRNSKNVARQLGLSTMVNQSGVEIGGLQARFLIRLGRLLRSMRRLKA